MFSIIRVDINIIVKSLGRNNDEVSKRLYRKKILRMYIYTHGPLFFYSGALFRGTPKLRLVDHIRLFFSFTKTTCLFFVFDAGAILQAPFKFALYENPLLGLKEITAKFEKTRGEVCKHNRNSLLLQQQKNPI